MPNLGRLFFLFSNQKNCNIVALRLDYFVRKKEKESAKFGISLIFHFLSNSYDYLNFMILGHFSPL